jgi:hypothetical protein
MRMLSSGNEIVASLIDRKCVGDRGLVFTVISDGN